MNKQRSEKSRRLNLAPGNTHEIGGFLPILDRHRIERISERERLPAVTHGLGVNQGTRRAAAGKVCADAAVAKRAWGKDSVELVDATCRYH